MSFALFGIGVCEGVAIGSASLVSKIDFDVSHRLLSDLEVEEEAARFDKALCLAQNELRELIEAAESKIPEEVLAFLRSHLLMLEDANIAQKPKERIIEERCNAEWALKESLDRLLKRFDDIDDAYLRDRREDVMQVAGRIMKHLQGASDAPLPKGDMVVIVAHSLSPADLMILKEQQVAAFLTDVGGVTSHTAILARSLGIPSVIALRNAHHLVDNEDTIIVDGTEGVVLVAPSQEELTEYRLRQQLFQIEQQKLERLTGAKAVTLDGTEILLEANIEFPSDVAAVHAVGAEGIGLLRSEFLFLNRLDIPSEEEQFIAYREVVESMAMYPVTIRTLDIGADKTSSGLPTAGVSPLGLRAIRFCLAEPQIFQTQLRAILRASHYGRVRLLLPLLSSLFELEQALRHIEQAKQALQGKHIPFDPAMPIGVMIEVPAAAILAEAFAKKADFLSIGTNDLIQYTLALDRSDDQVAYLYDATHPAVLRLIATTIAAAAKMNKPVSVCGEMAADIPCVRLLLGMGLREFSMHPAKILAVKKEIIRVDIAQLENKASRILKTSESERVQQLLGELNLL